MQFIVPRSFLKSSLETVGDSICVDRAEEAAGEKDAVPLLDAVLSLTVDRSFAPDLNTTNEVQAAPYGQLANGSARCHAPYWKLIS